MSFAALVGAGCAGGEFRVDSTLATAVLPVSGTIGLNIAHCHRDDAPPPRGLVADRDAAVSIGPLIGIASAPHRGVSNETLFGDAVLADYERFLRGAHDLARADRVTALRSMLSQSSSTDVAVGVAQVDTLLNGIDALLKLPRETTETMTFTLFAKREGRSIAAACATTEVARFLGFFDGPHFSMSCRIVSSADGAARDLHVRGLGTWADARFEGDLHGALPSETLSFASQSVTVLGAGAVRGFDLRSASGGQIAAISFWQVESPGGKAEPRAWALPQSSPGWSDALVTTLAIAYVFPWPTSCDDQHLREEGASPSR